ncbi:MAG: heavy metal transport/detoxification protein [Bacteroidia bacterium]|jgi:copper chaperone|nr:heavy metal transport/detoxification protein [Bacteroidia bacterium]
MIIKQFKTNMKCGGCVTTVTPFIESVDGLMKWEVDTNNPEKILRVELAQDDQGMVEAAVRQAGFNIELIG